MNADEIDFAAAAAYTPRGFAIELLHHSFDVPPDAQGIPTIPRERFPTLMHEVGHLVQDRATYRGVMDFLNLWDQVSAVADYVQRSGAEVVYPIVEAGGTRHRLRPEKAWAREQEILRAQTEPRGKWTSDERFWAFQRYRVEWRRLRLSGRLIEFPFVYVDLIDNVTREPYTHELGAWEIKEAYSVAVALLHGGNLKQPGSQFEYLVVERILAYHFGSVTPAQTIALCHWALQDLAPANALFTLIEHFYDDGHGRLPSPDAIYEAAKSEALRRGFADNCRDIIETLASVERGHAASNPYVACLFGWYRDHASRLLLLHLDSRRRFPLDTFLCEESRSLSDAERRSRLTSYFQEVQVPMVVGPEGATYTINATPEEAGVVFFNRCILDLLGRIWRGNRQTWGCPIYRACNLLLKDNDDCRRRPWKKGWVHPTCAYGTAAKVLGISPGKSLRHEPFPLTAAEHAQAEERAYYLSLIRGGGKRPPYDYALAVADFCQAAGEVMSKRPGWPN